MRRAAKETQSQNTHFYFPWFPSLQIGLALLFAAASLLGPLIVPRLDLLILVVSGLGLLLGLVTLRIGWRAAIEKRPVDYPFAGWSARIARRLLQPGQAGQTESANRRTGRPAKSKGKDKTKGQAPVSPRLLILGYASLVIGAALVLGILIFW